MGRHKSCTWISPISWQHANSSLISCSSHAHRTRELANILSTPRHRSSSHSCVALDKQFSFCTHVIVTTRAQKGPSHWRTPRYSSFLHVEEQLRISHRLCMRAANLARAPWVQFKADGLRTIISLTLSEQKKTGKEWRRYVTWSEEESILLLASLRDLM